MRFLSIWIRLAGAVALVVGPASQAAQPDGPPPPPRANAVLLLGANWCAPCLAELRELPALAAANAQGRIILLWEDGPPRPLWPRWPANAEIGTAAEAAALIGDGEISAGLPFSILLDGDAKTCLVWKGRLTGERLARLRNRCNPANALKADAAASAAAD
jgi:hypothetical protein